MSPQDGVHPIDAAATRALRQAILRPAEPIEKLAWPGDDAPRTLHLGSFVAGKLVAVATIIEDPEPGDRSPVSAKRPWRVRGMATLGEVRGTGHGGKLLVYLFVMGGMILPPEVALFPLFRILRALGLYDTYAAMIVPGSAPITAAAGSGSRFCAAQRRWCCAPPRCLSQRISVVFRPVTCMR